MNVLSLLFCLTLPICSSPSIGNQKIFRRLLLDWNICCFIYLLILFHCKLSPSTHTLTNPSLSLIVLSLAGRVIRWGKLNNYHPLLNYAALISWLGSSGIASTHIRMVIFSSKSHLFHSFGAATTNLIVYGLYHKKRSAAFICLPAICMSDIKSRHHLPQFLQDHRGWNKFFNWVW